MTRHERYIRKQHLVITICFILAIGVPLSSIVPNLNAYPAVPFGGGGGDAFPHIVNLYGYLPVCGPICGGFIGWAIGKALDYAITHWNDPMPGMTTGNASMGECCAVGGGGGDGF